MGLAAGACSQCGGGSALRVRGRGRVRVRVRLTGQVSCDIGGIGTCSCGMGACCGI